MPGVAHGGVVGPGGFGAAVRTNIVNRRHRRSIRINGPGIINADQSQSRSSDPLPRCLARQTDLKRIGRLPQKGCPTAYCIGIAKFEAIITLDVTILFLRQQREAAEQIIRDRHIDRTLEINPVIRAVGCCHIAFKFIVWLFRRDADRTTVGVTAKQRALRSAQHFNTFDIDQVEDTANRARNINTVDIQTDTGFGRRQKFFLPDTANIDGRRIAGTTEARIVLKR